MEEKHPASTCNSTHFYQFPARGVVASAAANPSCFKSTVHHRAKRQNKHSRSHTHTPTTNSEAPISSTCTVSGPWEEGARLADCVLLYRFSLFYTVGSRMVMMMFTSTLCYICNHGKLINIQHVLRAHHPPATIAPLMLSTTK